MGSRPGDPEGSWPRLVQDHAGDVRHLAADLLHQLAAGFRIRLTAVLLLDQQSLDTRCRCADQSRGTCIEAAPPWLIGLRPSHCDLVVPVRVGSGSAAERL